MNWSDVLKNIQYRVEVSVKETYERCLIQTKYSMNERMSKLDFLGWAGKSYDIC